MAPAEQPNPGLRERKKARTRSAIQSHALRLFREQGYEETTVQQIIDEVEVSESTFFRYFPTKADVVLSDEFDPVIVEAFRSQPAHLSSIQALRAAFTVAFSLMADDDAAAQRDRIVLIASVPELPRRDAGPVRLGDGAAQHSRCREDGPGQQRPSSEDSRRSGPRRRDGGNVRDGRGRRR